MTHTLRMHPRIFVAGFMVLFGSCPKFTTIENTCGTGANAAVCWGQMRVPQEHAHKFRDGGRVAIDIVYSPEFAERVHQYMDTALRNPEYATGDWEGLTASAMVNDLRARLPGLDVSTYGGPWHFLRYYFFDNVADDGKGAGPIRINRWVLPHWDAIHVGASLVHEASHRAGMTHYKDRKECGPPYVLHTIMEQIARGSAWKWNEANYCGSFRPASQSGSGPD